MQGYRHWTHVNELAKSLDLHIQKATWHNRKVQVLSQRPPSLLQQGRVPKNDHPLELKTWYFVLLYNETVQQLLILVPMMEPRGILSGKRQGRPRCQCVMGDMDTNFLQVSTQDEEPVEAFMVMRTPTVTRRSVGYFGGV
jgi:hypothetical protein